MSKSWFIDGMFSFPFRAVKSVLPYTDHHACTFHMTQATSRKIQTVGLANDPKCVCKLCSLLTAIPLVPTAHIITLFNDLLKQACIDPLRRLFDYVDSSMLLRYIEVM